MICCFYVCRLHMSSTTQGTASSPPDLTALAGSLASGSRTGAPPTKEAQLVELRAFLVQGLIGEPEYRLAVAATSGRP